MEIHENSLISIIVPIYNTEKYLYRCIDSIAKQTYKNLEIILVDDGSSDSCPQICDEYAENDKRIKILHIANCGASNARNVGMEISTGVYIMFCDSDDYVEPSWCQSLLQNMDDSSLAICGYNIVDERSVIKSVSRALTDNITELRRQDFFVLCDNYALNSLCTKIYVREKIFRNNLRMEIDLSLGEDLMFNLQYIKYIDKFKIVNKQLYNVAKTQSETLSSKRYNDFFDIQIKLLQEIYQTFKTNNINIDKYKTRYYDFYFKILRQSLEHTFHKKNKISFIEKNQYNNKLMQRKEFAICLKNIDREKYSKVLYLLYGSNKYILVYIYIRICALLGKLSCSVFQVK